MLLTSINRLRRAVLLCSVLPALILTACSGVPAGRSDPGLVLELFEEIQPGTPVILTAADSSEYTRRIAHAAAKMLSSEKVYGTGVELELRTSLGQWEDRSPGFLFKRYEINLNGQLVDEESEPIGSLEGRLEYRRQRLRLAISDEADQYEEWDRDFVLWTAGKIVEALTF